MSPDYLELPIDETARTALAGQGLRMELLDTSDPAAFERWMQVDSRGFHGGRLSEQEVCWWLEGLGDRRTVGVWDDGDDPVATVSSWPLPMTVPGAASVTSWGISSVTVAPTHRRRGIARAMLEAELRTARALGLPLAILTVSESTLYGRYGFAPAAFASEFRIDTTRAGWAGPEPAGRIAYVTIEQWREQIEALHERARLASPGSVEVFPLRWDQLSGAKTEDKGRIKQMQAIDYTDEQGVRGLAIFHVGGGEDDFTRHHLTLDHLCAETPGAYAALWRFLLELPLISEVRARLRPVDEPVRWMVRDQRGIHQTVTDHHWVRILDVPAALTARRYERDGVLEFTIVDDLGFAGGDYRLEVVDGAATVAPGSGGVELTVAELSAAYLGAVPPVTPELALLGTLRAPWLGTWY